MLFGVIFIIFATARKLNQNHNKILNFEFPQIVEIYLKKLMNWK